MWRYLIEVILLALAVAVAAGIAAVLQHFGKPVDKTKLATWGFISFVVAEVLCIYHFDSAVQFVFLAQGEWLHYMIPAGGMRETFANVTRCTNKLQYDSGSGQGWKEGR